MLWWAVLPLRFGEVARPLIEPGFAKSRFCEGFAEKCSKTKLKSSADNGSTMASSSMQPTSCSSLVSEYSVGESVNDELDLQYQSRSLCLSRLLDTVLRRGCKMHC
jgi:hypothetical protein